MMKPKIVKSFKYKIYSDRVVVEQIVTTDATILTPLRKTSIIKLSILVDGTNSINELQRLYKLTKEIIKQYKCCFVLLSEIAQTQLRYKLEII